ncbi:helix-turn-helix domain-containing protein [Ulvibacter litoralis]|uniref:AraC-type DNA-binding protein n=1 Tax=Ulvibacter litoralis TaxID=227084 RepID=A0A1G7GUF9_9FLAO|nr:helix-turn-helix domain-containing protein [Ulvibacter litoralis]GHC60102.1 hypothetical protein GCM10008083_26420 [Ulvibacter litoralis]SDE91589.1 AraC-type DNA-binding protein [Ulvibacter litoralis]
MRLLLSFWLLILVCNTAYTQEHNATKDLLQEAKGVLFSQPEQTEKIADYILNKSEDKSERTEASLLLAQSFYVRGNFSKAVKEALSAKELADNSGAIEIQLKANLFAIQMLRMLGLDTVADSYLSEVIVLRKNIEDPVLSTWLEGKLNQDKAFINFDLGHTSKTIDYLQKARFQFLKSRDTTAVNDASLSLVESFMQVSKIDSANYYLEPTIEDIRTTKYNDFQKLKALDHLGKLYFLKNDYPNAIEVYQEALNLSKKLPNTYYENNSLDGLAINYLAMEDTENFYHFKQKNYLTELQVDTEERLAVNAVYSTINNQQQGLSEEIIESEYHKLYALGAFLLLILTLGLFLNYQYKSKAKEYTAIWKYISPAKKDAKATKPKKVLEKSALVPEETEQVLLQKLEKFEAGKKFTNSDMSIALLASQMDTNTKYLSDVINRHKGKNFNSYVNELRINYIIEKIKDNPVYFNYKVSYLASECGFSSHSSFTTVFKSVTGISPTAFMDFLKKRSELA